MSFLPRCTWILFSAPFISSVFAVFACAGEDKKGPILTETDKRYLDGLAKDFVFDPSVARRVRVKAIERDVWTESETVEREGWFVAAQGDRPARVYFTDGEWLPAPPDKEMTKVEAGATIRVRLGLHEKQKSDDKAFEAVRKKAVAAVGASDLILAAWLHSLGEEALAARALALARARQPEEGRDWGSPARPIFLALVHAYMVRADDDALNHGERLLRLFPQEAKANAQVPDIVDDLRRRKKKGTFGKKPAEKLPDGYERWDATKKVAYCIDALDEVDVRQGGQPAPVPLYNDGRVKALVDLGEAAVPALIDAIEKDERLTRSVYFWRDFSTSRTVLGVRQPALTALTAILWMRVVDTNFESDDATLRGKQQAFQTTKELRAFWSTYGGMKFDERMMAVLSDKDAKPQIWRDAAKNLAGINQQYVGVFPPREPRKGPNPAVAKFKAPTAAEAILMAFDRDLKAHDAGERDDRHEYTRNEIEGIYIDALVELQDKRVAPELVKRFEKAETFRMQRRLAVSAHWLGNDDAIKPFAEICRMGRAELPARTIYTTPLAELYYTLRSLAETGLPEADGALYALAQPKHPWHAMVKEAVLEARPIFNIGINPEWLFHPYCLLFLRPVLDDKKETGMILKIEEGGITVQSKSISGSQSFPPYLQDPKQRNSEARERKCDLAATHISFLAAGVPAYHPLLKDADDRLSKMKAALDRFPTFRLATIHETAILRSPAGADPEKSFDLDDRRYELFVPAIGLLDRPANNDDVKAGKALFHLNGKGRLHDLHLPAYGIVKNEKSKQQECVLIVQAEVGPDGEVAYGAISRNNVRVIPGKDLEKTKSIGDWKKETEK